MLYLDTETFNETPIKWGTYRYVSTCEVMLLTFAIDDGPVHCWDLTRNERAPSELMDYLAGDGPITAHNAMFDRNVLKYALKIEVALERWRCTMVRALAHALPGGLDPLCDIMRVSQDKAKLKDGKALVRLFCQPRPKNAKIRRATAASHPEEWATFVRYACKDIEAMRELDRVLPTWNTGPDELALYHLDQKINDRGFLVDIEFAEGAMAAVAKEQARLGKRTGELTLGMVESATKRDELIYHLVAEYGVTMHDMQASTIERRLDDPNLPEEVKELLRLRLSSTTTSTAKYKAMVNAALPDGRVRGTLQFNGAGRTRRWAGRTVQPQNLARSTMPHSQIELAIEATKAGALELIW